MYVKKFPDYALAVVIDSLNSIYRTSSQYVSEDEFLRIEFEYRVVFAGLAAAYQRVVYVASPDGYYWCIWDPPRFNRVRDALCDMALKNGILVVQGDWLLGPLKHFKRDDWRFLGRRQQEYTVVYLWQRIIGTLCMLGMNVLQGDTLRFALSAIPLAVSDLGQPNPLVSLQKPTVSSYTQPLVLYEHQEKFFPAPVSHRVLA